MEIRPSVLGTMEELRSVRRQLHRIPETAFEEHETSRFLRSYLERLEPDCLETYAGTGLRAVFRSSGCSHTIGVRADMDALPVQEETGLEFASGHAGVMHACGHDGHMAMALLTASLCAQARPALKSNCVFIFQPAEESVGGAKPLVEAGVLEDPHVDELYGVHLWPLLEAGKLGLASGPLMAGTSDFDLIVEGTGGHGARPQDGTDAVVAGAYLVTALQSIVSRSVDPEQAAVLTIGKVHGGVANNILCDRLCMQGTIRTFDRAVDQIVRGRMSQCMSGVESMFDVTVRSTYHMSYPPVVNPDPLYRKVVNLLNPDDWLPAAPVMISEDFSFYQEAVPAFFAFLGTRTSDTAEPLHSARFDFDEHVLLQGVEYYARVLGL